MKSAGNGAMRFAQTPQDIKKVYIGDISYTIAPVTVAEWLQWLASPLPTGRRWLRFLGLIPGGSVGGAPDHA